MKDEDRFGGYTPWRATRFYVPLLIQAFSQCLTYPLVAAIVSHGPTGVSTLTAFAQGQTVMHLDDGSPNRRAARRRHAAI